MSSELHPGNASGEKPGAANPSVRYEPQDFNAGTIVKYLAALLITIFASMLVAWGVYRALIARAAQQVPYVSPLRQGAGRILPPEPRLQGGPGHPLPPQEEFRRMRAEVQARLESYGWVDEKAGIARVPIEEAMRLLAEWGPPGTRTAEKTRAPQQTLPPGKR